MSSGFQQEAANRGLNNPGGCRHGNQNVINGSDVGANGRHLLDHPVFAGGEVVFGGVDEGNPEVEEQVDDQRPRVLRQEDLQAGQTAEVRAPGS